MYFARRLLIPLMLIGILLTSCGGQAAGQPTPDINGTIQAGAGTLAAALFETQTALAPPATDTALPTLTSFPTSPALALPSPIATITQPVILYAAPIPTGTFYTLTPSASSLAVGCNNLRLIESFTDPDGPYTPGQKFTQYWQVENNGTCDWLYLYTLVYVSGDRMGGSPGNFGKKIPPYKWTTLSVGLTAPKNKGTYNASWRFSDGNGKAFGSTLPVSITVKTNPDPTKTPDVTQIAADYTAIAQTAAAAQTAISAQQTAQAAGTQTAAAQQTAISVGQTAIACQTAVAQGTPPPCP
jgi:hypothetical protein